jgi:MIP family channel proteins
MARDGLRQELYAEFLGTFILIMFGAGVVAQMVLSEGRNGNYLVVNLGWGLGVTMGIYVAATVSGAHLNPAVSLAFALRRSLPWRKVLPYSLAQTAGAFFASATVFFTYRQAFTAFDGGVRTVAGAKATAGIFATYPQPFLSAAGGLVDQVVGTALLLMLICAISDSRNNRLGANLAPILIGLVVVAIGMCFGFNCGYPINPARDIGPRVFTFVAGWGAEVFRAGNYWFWVPIVGPLLGGPLGVLVYDLAIGRFLAQRETYPSQ